MASSMLTAEVSASASTQADVNKALKATLHSCVNNPDFAIVCDFLQKFSKDLGLDLPNFKFLLQWLTKTDEVSPQLRDMQIKLLRKTRKTVHEKSWESALSKFCFTYSAQDGWEIERFGYKNSSAKVKLRILRELLEYQFENNTKFRAKVLALSADSLRSKPIGRDRQGHCYWVTIDSDCNISIYQEHLDEEIWQVVATNRDEFVTLLKRLKESEIILPCKDISMVDGDTTSNSSQIDSDSARKVPPFELIDKLPEDEQKVPKLSIRFVQGGNLIETSNAKDLSKGEEELAAEEDAKLLKKSDKCSDESDEEEFEELEEYEDESSAETESDNTKKDKKIHSKENKTEQKCQKNLKPKDYKKVEPLLISQNKVINNQSCSSYSNTGVKRSLDEENFVSSPVNDNQLQKYVPQKRIRTTLLDPKTESKYEYNKKKFTGEYNEATTDDIEVEEEVEEEDIDSVAAEEDEDEEKNFEDYDDDDEEVGEEIFDPTLHVVGEGSGKDCDAENYLFNIDFDFENDHIGLSDIIVEKVYYFYGEGHGKECLVGNNKKEDETNIVDKNSKEEDKSEQNSEMSLKNEDNKKTMFQENIHCSKLSISKKNVSNEDIDTKGLALNSKEEICQINGGKISEVTCKTEKSAKKVIYESQLDENASESASKDSQSINISPKSTVSDVLTQQTNSNKVLALESIKKELREPKQELLETHIAESSKIKLTICNRKRRLTDPQQATTARLSNSESETELNSENNEDYPNDKLKNDESGQDIGGKRLKMRIRQANTELRKKIEAQKVAATEETTSSSGGEEELAKRKKINLSKQSIISAPILKSEKILEYKKDISGHNENLMDIEDKFKSDSLTRQPVPLKQAAQIKHNKDKQTLAEIIEKKLKKTSEKIQYESNNENNMQNAATAKKSHIPNKSPITKPLKKNLLIHIRQAESDEDEVARKSIIGQEISTEILDNAKPNETTNNCNINKTVYKSCNKKLKVTPERQRKRRSSEETIKNESNEEPETKKEVTIVNEKLILKRDKPTEAFNQDIVKENRKDLEDHEKSQMAVAGRRSGRRSGAAPTYVDTFKTKRNLCSTKSPIKTEFTGKRNAEKLSDIKTKPMNEKNDMKEIEIKANVTLLEIKKVDVTQSKSSLAAKTPTKGNRKQQEVDTSNIIDIDSETPVRQSRRIAQQKIREEAERRKLEEIALRTMKKELKKKKKAEKQTDPTVVPPTEPSSESEESDLEIKRKVQKKKCPGKNGNWSSGSEEQEEPEEEDEEHPHYESDAGSPLFKSDHEFSPESDIEDETQVVPMKRARTVRKEDADGEAIAKDEEEEEACQKCNKSDHPEWILLCDNCDKGYHCSCLSPVLFYIPEGDWYCPPCQQEQLIKALENQLKEFDDLVENKKKMEEHEKRMAEEEKARQEREEEANKLKNRNESKRNINSSGDHYSHEEGDGGAITYSECSRDNESDNQSSKKKYRNRTRNFKNIDKRKHRDRRTNTTRSRRNRLHKPKSYSDSDSQQSSKSNSSSKSISSSSSTYSESDNEPIYKLRKRRQINVSYRLNEYDDLINSALKKEMDEAAGAGNLGRGKDISTIIEADKEEKARQKQIDNGDIVGNIKEEKINEVTRQDLASIEPNETNERNELIKLEEIDSDAEPIIRKLNIKQTHKKKSRKLTTLDISSEDDDGSDEDFKGSSIDDDEEEEDTSISASNSDSSLEIYKKHGKFKKKRRKAARRAFRSRRRGRRYFVEESDDEDVQRPKSKKKRKEESDYTESEADDDDISELSENIDSADLCDDTTTDESDVAWRPNKRKKEKKSIISNAQKSPKTKISHCKKTKKIEYSDDDVSDSEEEDDSDNEEVGSGKGIGKQPRSQPLKNNSSSSKTKGKGKEKPVAKIKKKKFSDDGSSQSDSEDSTRRTRGRRYAYIEDFDDDSSDGGIKPGVQRPDTPPEEREKFIKRQEEIKRMLAEKNAEGAKIVATPRLTPIKADVEKDKRSTSKVGSDSLSTVPLSVIRQAKVLDIDYLQRRGENLVDLSAEVGDVDDDFDDADLPDDLPEDVDEDAIARMVEEEEFGDAAAKELPVQEEVLRTAAAVKSTKPKEVDKHFLPGNTSQFTVSSPQLTTAILPTSTSVLQEPVRKKLPMPTMHPPLLRNQFLMHDSIPNHHLLQRHGGAHTSHLLQNALSAPLTHLDRNYPSLTPSASHHSLMNRMTHSIPLQTPVSQALNTARPSHPPISVNTKSASLFDQPAQEKSANLQTFPENKPRGRRKKITPLRDTLQKQQTAAAVTAATASSSALVKNIDPVSTSLLSSVIKSGTTPKLTMQGSITSNMLPTSHSTASRPGVPMPSVRGPYIRPDSPRFYDTLGNRISQTNTHRHRGPPQMPPSLLPPHPANRSSYGPPPPLKGSTAGTPVSSASNTSGSIKNPLHHIPPPYLGMPPNPRHASHLNMYSRPPIYGNPNFGSRVNLRPSNIHPPDYLSGPRAYPPYGFYPPPPPLTTPGQRPGPSSITRPSTQMPPTHPPASVIVSASPSKSSNTPSVTSRSPPSTAPQITDFSCSPNKSVATQELQIKRDPQKSSSQTIVIADSEKIVKVAVSMIEPRKKLTTLQAYSASNEKKSTMLLASDLPESRSPHNQPTVINEESPGSSENTPMTEQTSRQEGQDSEFSGLVSYFSSQHDDYNT